MSLQAKLDAFKADVISGDSPHKIAAADIDSMLRATAELIASGAAQRALKAGDLAPAFRLKDPEGNDISSTELLGRGPLVLSFYRGVWCPYCNMELQALQDTLAELQRYGAGLVAISPQSSVNSRKSVRQNKLTFPILTDPGNDLAAAFGLRYKLPDYLIEIYRKLKNDLPAINGDQSWTLPMPARYVIAPDSRILYAEVNPDFTRRPEPGEMIPILRHAGNGAA